MADLSDVVATLAAQVTALVYPTGTGNPPVAGSAISIMQGWPLDSDIDAMIASFNATPSVVKPLISVYGRPGTYRNTSRYPTKWQERARPAVTVTAIVSGHTITIGGTPAAGQNVILVVGYGGVRNSFAYPVQAGDTLAAIATALAALVNAATPATVFGAVITIAAAWEIIARVGVIGTAIRELRRQEERIDINIWTPSPPLRDLIGAPIRVGLARLDYITLPDSFAARIRACDDHWLDDPAKIGLYRRLLSFDVDYATTETTPATEIIVFESQSDQGNIFI